MYDRYKDIFIKYEIHIAQKLYADLKPSLPQYLQMIIIDIGINNMVENTCIFILNAEQICLSMLLENCRQKVLKLHNILNYLFI